MFNGMGQAFMQREFEFRNPPETRYSLTSFLMRFDAIFTLNQDTLLEQKYIPFVGPPKWGRAHLPGTKYPMSQLAEIDAPDRRGEQRDNCSGNRSDGRGDRIKKFCE
jgi:hypothetical protein